MFSVILPLTLSQHFVYIFTSNLALFRLFNMKSSNPREWKWTSGKMEIEWETFRCNEIEYPIFFHSFSSSSSYFPPHHHLLCSTMCQRYDCHDFIDLHLNFITVCCGLPVCMCTHFLLLYSFILYVPPVRFYCCCCCWTPSIPFENAAHNISRWICRFVYLLTINFSTNQTYLHHFQ